ncbi:prophage lysozyme [Escherichia coli]|uniref:Prophage lysozyme n=1 Tax=Escherichia coli TaxID=562 RepID=A0A377CZQ4_ECOLX|nr:prophage lysozyme [Escherichia coli]
MFQRIYDHITFFTSVMVTGIGVMTLSEKMALAGLILGALSLLRGWMHRTRMEQAQERRNELIARIADQMQHRPLKGSEKRALEALNGRRGITCQDRLNAMPLPPSWRWVFSLAPGELRTSQEAQEKIATWEECRAFPYRDIAGVKTVGCGSTGNVPDRHHTKQEVAGRWGERFTTGGELHQSEFQWPRHATAPL